MRSLSAVLALACAPFAVATCSASTAADSGKDSTEQVAVVDGTPITMGELDASLGTSLSKLEQDIYNLKKDRLDAMIGDKLLEREAAKRGIAVKDLLAAEVTAKVTQPTDQEVDAFYEANKARLPTAPDIKSQIKQYLANQRTQALAQSFVASLRTFQHSGIRSLEFT